MDRWRNISLLGLLLGAGCCLASAGCGGGPRTVRVRGIVTYKGAPLPHGTLTFSPQAQGAPATASLKPNGSFTPTTPKLGDGLVAGEYLIGVQSFLPGPDGKIPTDPPKIPGGGWAIPVKYGDVGTSGLKIKVTEADAGQEFKLELRD